MTTDERKRFMIDYLKLKIQEQDWHGVADAAMDLREIEVELRCTNEDLIIVQSGSGENT